MSQGLIKKIKEDGSWQFKEANCHRLGHFIRHFKLHIEKIKDGVFCTTLTSIT